MDEMFLIGDVAALCGVQEYTILYAERVGKIPRSGKWGNRKVWTRGQVEEIAEHFRRRQEAKLRSFLGKGHA